MWEMVVGKRACIINPDGVIKYNQFLLHLKPFICDLLPTLAK